jgi:hypothetical protein
MGTPAKLPANFFESKTAQASPPKTLPANFDFKKGAAPVPETNIEKGASQATGLRAQPQGQAGLNEFLDSPFGKEMRKANADAAGFGANMLGIGELAGAGKALFKPTVSMVPEVSKLLDASGKPFVNMIEKEGASAAGKAVGLTKQAIGKILTWVNKNPVQSYAIYKGLEELGIAPHKVVKMLHVAAKE